MVPFIVRRVCVVGVVAALAGCGGSKSEARPATAPPSASTPAPSTAPALPSTSWPLLPATLRSEAGFQKLDKELQQGNGCAAVTIGGFMLPASALTASIGAAGGDRDLAVESLPYYVEVTHRTTSNAPTAIRPVLAKYRAFADALIENFDREAYFAALKGDKAAEAKLLPTLGAVNSTATQADADAIWQFLGKRCRAETTRWFGSPIGAQK